MAALLDWVGHQRWYAVRAPGESTLSVTEVASVGVQDGLDIAWWILTIDQPAARPIQLLLAMACCSGVPPVTDTVRTGDLSWFDALGHPVTAAHALAMLGAGGRSGIEAVWLDDTPLVLDGLQTAALDQSNTSVHTAEHVLKVFRRLQVGRNPEIEVGAALRAARSTHVAPIAGWVTISTTLGPCDVLAVHRRVAGVDGFELAVADADRSTRGEDELHFPGAAYELGIALGAVHADLAAAFGEREVAGYGAELSRRLLARLDAIRDVEVLEPYLATAEGIFTGLARSGARVTVHRIHGDLHLGQTLFAADGWRLIDFEGEPRRPIAERAAADTPLRDLAGMLRSFDYAARWNATAPSASAEWRSRTAGLFLEGYHLQRPDAVERDLLDALVLDKALYEVGYEAAYRPERLRIPLSAVAALCGGG